MRLELKIKRYLRIKPYRNLTTFDKIFEMLKKLRMESITLQTLFCKAKFNHKCNACKQRMTLIRSLLFS